MSRSPPPCLPDIQCFPQMFLVLMNLSIVSLHTANQLCLFPVVVGYHIYYMLPFSLNKIFWCFIHQFSSIQSLNRVRLFATLWIIAYQAPPSMGFSKQEYWSGVPLHSSKKFHVLLFWSIDLKFFLSVSVEVLSHI